MDRRVLTRLELKWRQRRLAIVFQDLGLWPNLTVWSNVMLGLASCRLSKIEKRERTAQVLQVCKIGGLGKRQLSGLSGGEQQRVALARALAVEPQLLLLEEPGNGLDLALRHAFLRQVVELSEEMGTAVLLVSHNLHDAQVIRGSLAVVEDAKLETFYTVEQVLASNLTTLESWCDEFGTEMLFNEHGSSGREHLRLGGY
jgi:ABC-type sulfate/molybdate transport systems ATPase subunit